MIIWCVPALWWHQVKFVEQKSAGLLFHRAFTKYQSCSLKGTVFHPKILKSKPPRTMAHIWSMITGAGRPLGIFGHRNPDLGNRSIIRSPIWGGDTGHQDLWWTGQCLIEDHRNVHKDIDIASFRFQYNPNGFMDCIHLNFGFTYGINFTEI